MRSCQISVKWKRRRRRMRKPSLSQAPFLMMRRTVAKVKIIAKTTEIAKMLFQTLLDVL